MNQIKEIRKINKITQEEAAKLVGISLRSFKSYENDITKENTIKYNYILKTLTDTFKVDEENGLISIDIIKEKSKVILDKYEVNFCYLFGSYAKHKENPRSDVDLLIDTTVSGLEFFGLIEELRVSFGKKVDLVKVDYLENNNQLTKEILKDGIKIYG